MKKSDYLSTEINKHINQYLYRDPSPISNKKLSKLCNHVIALLCANETTLKEIESQELSLNELKFLIQTQLYYLEH